MLVKKHEREVLFRYIGIALVAVIGFGILLHFVAYNQAVDSIFIFLGVGLYLVTILYDYIADNEDREEQYVEKHNLYDEKIDLLQTQLQRYKELRIKKRAQIKKDFELEGE